MKKQLTQDDVIFLLRKRIAEVGNQKIYAERIGASSTYVSDVLKKKREPGEKILEALGLEKITVYIMKE